MEKKSSKDEIETEVESKETANRSWNTGLAEQYVPLFEKNFECVGPKNKLWMERVKREIQALSQYVTFLKSELPRPWFLLKPDRNPKYNYCIWRGFLQVPEYPEIKFEMVILLNSEYPKVIPRCLLEEKIVDYSGKLYLKNIWVDPESKRRYIMICHDHMSQLENVWAPNLGIVHFFIREVWFWFAAMQNIIIDAYQAKHGKK